jgi:hypothetical protein
LRRNLRKRKKREREGEKKIQFSERRKAIKNSQLEKGNKRESERRKIIKKGTAHTLT